MNYHNITFDDMNNGDGLRVVLWVAGCEHHCKNCQNPVTWEPEDGIPFGLQDKKNCLEHWRRITLLVSPSLAVTRSTLQTVRM